MLALKIAFAMIGAILAIGGGMLIALGFELRVDVLLSSEMIPRGMILFGVGALMVQNVVILSLLRPERR